MGTNPVQFIGNVNVSSSGYYRCDAEYIYYPYSVNYPYSVTFPNNCTFARVNPYNISDVCYNFIH